MTFLKRLYYLTYAVVALVVVGILFFEFNLRQFLGEDGIITFWIWVSALLLVMLTIGIIGDYAETRSLARQTVQLKQENQALKARVYELTNPPGTDPRPVQGPVSAFFNKLGFGGHSDAQPTPPPTTPPAETGN